MPATPQPSPTRQAGGPAGSVVAAHYFTHKPGQAALEKGIPHQPDDEVKLPSF